MHPLISLARESIKAHFHNKNIDISPPIKKQYSQNQACFVTLTEGGELRGCIGSLLPHQPLYQDIIDNAVNAAFHDPRFQPVKESELITIKIEISLLTIPKPLLYTSPEDLLKKLNPNMGIILKKSYYQATFLPQVWEELPDKIQFLEYLSRKAGLNKDDWKTAEYEFYTVEKIEE